MIALITPTGVRPKQLELCSIWMQNQTYTEEVLWILVDDGVEETIHTIPDTFREGWEIVKIRPEQKWKKGMNTQASNLQQAINVIKERGNIDLIFVIEDDDYYSTTYLQSMVDQANGYDMVGEICTIYYNIYEKKWYNNMNVRHISLFQIAFRSNLIETFEKYLGEKFIDINFSKSVQNKKLIRRELPWSIGIKGLPGRDGIGVGHKMNPRYLHDKGFSRLRELMGDDYVYYVRLWINN